MGAQLGLLKDGLQTHAAGHNESDPTSVGLPVLTEPAQEAIRRLPALPQFVDSINGRG